MPVPDRKRLPGLDDHDVGASLPSMTATAILGLKQRLTKLSERERREVSAFLLQLGQESPAWRKETARRLKNMAAGKRTSVAELRERLGHAR